LLPQSTSAGAVPDTVTTDQNGLATFTLTYVQEHFRHVKIDC